MFHPIVSRAAPAVLLALGFVLVSCGGEGDAATNQGGGIPASGPAPVAATTGRLVVTVTDQDGAPLRDTKVRATNNVAGPSVALFRTYDSVTDQNGMATFDSVEAVATVCVEHPLVLEPLCIDHVDVRLGGTTALSMPIYPVSPVTVALHPPAVSAGSVSADRTEFDLQVSIVASAVAPFVPSYYGSDLQPAAHRSVGASGKPGRLHILAGFMVRHAYLYIRCRHPRQGIGRCL